MGSESELGGLLHDIHEALVMAQDHGELPPVRILRILAGEGHGMFNSDKHHNLTVDRGSCGVPLSAAMDYVGAILDDSSGKIHRLKVIIIFSLVTIFVELSSVQTNVYLSKYTRIMWKNTAAFVMIWSLK